MARMIPELNDQELSAFRSRAEARFYEACRDQLDKDILVIHSARWVYRDAQGRVREGEADFTVVMPISGVFAVEVKGGGVAFDAQEGLWYSIDREGVRHQIKDPFRQATRERYAIRDQLKGHPQWRRWKGHNVTIGHAVMLPDISDVRAIAGPDRPLALIGGIQDILNLPTWFEQVVNFWRRDEDDQLGREGVRLIEDILCRSVEVRPALKAMLEDAERQRIRLTNNQAKILRVIGGRKRAVIAGGAGTGKTLIAVEKARQLAQAGLSVLLLCYNRPLADLLSAALREESRVQVSSFHQLCERRIALAHRNTGRDLLAEATSAYPGNSEQSYFEVQMPFALALSNEVIDERFDAVIVDEAQDFSDEYWFAIEELLRSQTDGYLYIFIDQNQTLYRRHANLPLQDEAFYLTANCRNTAPIHEVGYSFYQGEPVDCPELSGPAVERLAVDGDAGQADAIARRVGRLICEEGLESRDLVVLLAKRPKLQLYELLRTRPLPGGMAWAFEAHNQPRAVLVETVARFKGLEAHVVVLWLGDEIVDERALETLYVGTTRAKSILCIVGSNRALTWACRTDR